MKTLRQTFTALRALLVLTLVLGIAYPLVILGIGQVALPAQANGQSVSVDGSVVGSALIGQRFTDAEGAPLPGWFQSRPSAADYDGGASTGSNLGPENPELVAAIEQRFAAIENLDGTARAGIPADAVTASGSGLDPHVSPEYALSQVARVAAARDLDEGTVRSLVLASVEGRDLGYLGEPRVNVLRLNVALAELE